MIASPIRSEDWSIPSSLSEVRATTDRVIHFLKPLKLGDSDVFDVRLCFEESLINSIKYGNLEKREVPVLVQIAYNDKEIFMALEDKGEGFDPTCVKDPTCVENIEAFSGRGVYLIRHLMDNVCYNRKGNRVEMTKVYNKRDKV